MPAARHAISFNFERFQDAPGRSGRAWLLGDRPGHHHATADGAHQEPDRGQEWSSRTTATTPGTSRLRRSCAEARSTATPIAWSAESERPTEIALGRSLLRSISSRTRAHRTGGRLRRTFASLTRRILRFALKVDSRGRRASCGRARKDLPRQPDETIKILPSRPSLYNSISLLLAPFDDTLRASRAGGLRYLYCRSPAIS